MKPVIETRNLTKRFGRNIAVDDLNLNVLQGSIFAFLGPNGAGKTTTIKTMMNIIPSTSGSVKVLDTYSRKLGPAQFQKIGYVSENQKLPEWMTVGQFLQYCRDMYPDWDDAFCERLTKQFDLPSDQKLSRLSRGMKMKAALVSSLAYHPKLLVLDEPFSGLDPLVREEFISGMLDITADQAWTIFVSSHDVDEVERLADWVGVIDKGRLKLTEETENLQNRFKQVTVTLMEESDKKPVCPESWLFVQREGRTMSFTDSQYEKEETENTIRALLPRVFTIDVKGMRLREIFLILAKQYRISNV